MSSNCFVRQEATLEIIENVTNFCSECYDEILEASTIFYDMQNFRYLCASCQNRINESLDKNCELINSDSTSLFNA